MSLQEQNKSHRVAILLDHSGVHDGRMLRGAHALRNEGFDVRLFALDRDDRSGLKPDDEISGIARKTVHLDQTDIVPMPWPLIRMLRRLRHRRTDSSEEVWQPTPEPASAAETEYRPSSANEANTPRWIVRINRTLGSLFWHRAVTRLTLPELQRFDPDIIHAHDLSMLGAGAVAARVCQAKLIYDAHEFERDRNAVIPGFAEQIRQSWEQRFIGQAHAVVTVSEMIASCLHRLYPITRPIVIPNASRPKREGRSFSRHDFGLSDDADLALYVGSFQPGRGLEELIRALPEAPSVHLMLAGYADAKRIQTLLNAAREASVDPRVTIIPPVDPDDVPALIGMADVTVIPIQDGCGSYRMCLPNKLFQSLAAGVPVISTPLPELSAILAELRGGITANSVDPGDIVRALGAGLPPERAKPMLTAPYTDASARARYVEIARSALSGIPLKKLPQLPHTSRLNEDDIEFETTRLPKLRRAGLLTRLMSLWMRLEFR